MLESKPKRYEFRNSKKIYGISIILSIIIPSVLAYFVVDNRKLLILVIVLGLLSLVYYSRKFLDRKIKVAFDSEGIITPKKLIKWEKIKSVEIKITHFSGQSSSNYDLVIHLKKDNEVWIDITNVNLTEDNLRMMLSQFDKKTAANSGLLR
jgi:hypothetical protein